MKRKTLFSICSALLACGVIGVVGSGCGDDDDTTATPTPDAALPETSKPDTSTNPDTGVDSGGNPPVPTLGAQIDRMGRPAIATALISAFEATQATKDTAKNEYNANATQSGWVAAYGTPGKMGGHLAIYDGLDVAAVPGDGCGNQLLAKDGGLLSNNTNAGVYGTLAGVLADDRLWMNTAGTAATAYLGVEGNAVGLAGLTMERGGRTLTYDVIDITYSAVAIGAFSGVTDAIAADATKTGGTTFPYLAAP
jgi:hypothetical protein